MISKFFQRAKPYTFLRNVQHVKNSYHQFSQRNFASGRPPSSTKYSNGEIGLFLASGAIIMVGITYAGVPAYRMFCQSMGFGGYRAQTVEDINEKVRKQKKQDRVIKVNFTSDVSSNLQWNFKPQQSTITLHPGETALAFYTAENPTNSPIIGVSTYSINPYGAAQYFNKIQCFCFEEQRLDPKDVVDLPVFFYLDQAIVNDPFLDNCKEITLSYCFFEAKDNDDLQALIAQAQIPQRPNSNVL